MQFSNFKVLNIHVERIHGAICNPQIFETLLLNSKNILVNGEKTAHHIMLSQEKRWIVSKAMANGYLEATKIILMFLFLF